jgi:hypothetical protein
VPKAQDGKQPAADAEQGKLEEAILHVRDLLYCDKSLDEALDIFTENDEAVGRAVADVRAKEYARARATLRGLKGRGESAEDLPYWLALAAAHKGEGNAEEARAAARRPVSSEETRVRLQAWSVLRELGESPPAEQADEVLGVVVEVALDEGVAIIAGYNDGRARLFFSRGGGVIGDSHPEPAQKAAKELTRTAAPLASSLAAGSRQALPANGRVRFTLLTPSCARVAEDDTDRVEESGHRLYEVYAAALGLFAELNKTYEAK